MSVEIKSLGGNVLSGVGNGTFNSAVFLAKADGVHQWAGHHDEGQNWTPAECRLMAHRMKQMGELAQTILDCAEDGGFTIS